VPEANADAETEHSAFGRRERLALYNRSNEGDDYRARCIEAAVLVPDRRDMLSARNEKVVALITFVTQWASLFSDR